jgi:hypothetical protein
VADHVFALGTGAATVLAVDLALLARIALLKVLRVQNVRAEGAQMRARRRLALKGALADASSLALSAAVHFAQVAHRRSTQAPAQLHLVVFFERKENVR